MNKTNPTCRRPALCIVIASLLTLLIWLTTMGLATYRHSTHGIDVTAGGVTFRDHCGACHVVEKGVTTHHGPNLYNFGQRAATRRPGITAAEYVLESILDPDVFVHPDNHRGMPKSLANVMSPAEIRNVIAYVAGRGATPDYVEIGSLEIPDLSDRIQQRVISRKDMALATDVLRREGKCLECHTLFRNAEYTVLAPAIFGVGLADPALIREAIVDPSRTVSPYHRWVSVSTVDGRVVTGQLIAQDEERLVMLHRATDGDLKQIDISTADIEQEDNQLLIVPSQRSPMPDGFRQLLSEQELDALVRMIRQLN